MLLQLTRGEEALLLEQLHDQRPPLVQRSAQGRVGHLVKLQVRQDVFSFCAWMRNAEKQRQASAGC